MREDRKVFGFWRESLKERDHLKTMAQMGSECILGRLIGGVWSGFNWLRIGAGGGLS
jgi:hypothetical protein